MKASSFDTVIARCMTDSTYLQEFIRTPVDRLHDNPKLCANAELLAQLDKRRVKALSGLITKVQNNHTYALIPFTRKLLRQSHLEMPLFMAYHSIHQWSRCRRHLSRANRTAVFLRFLNSWLEGLDIEHKTIMRDMLRHERICWQMDQWRQFKHSPHPAPYGMSGHLDENLLEWVPRTLGYLRIGRYSNNPLTIARLLAEGECNVFKQPSENCVIAYWAESHSGVYRQFRISQSVGELLLAIDGRTPLFCIVKRVVGEDTSEEAIIGMRDLFSYLLKNRLVTFQMNSNGGVKS